MYPLQLIAVGVDPEVELRLWAQLRRPGLGSEAQLRSTGLVPSHEVVRAVARRTVLRCSHGAASASSRASHGTLFVTTRRLLFLQWTTAGPLRRGDPTDDSNATLSSFPYSAILRTQYEQRRKVYLSPLTLLSDVSCIQLDLKVAVTGAFPYNP